MSDAIEALLSAGRGSFSCPSCGQRASDNNAYPYCDRCSEDQIRTALRSAPQECEQAKTNGFSHNSRQCLTCRVREGYIGERADLVLAESQVEAVSMRVTGDVLLDMPAISPIWGRESGPFSAEGQPWMVVGSDGTGKTSTAGQYAKARLGLTGEMWDEPVVALPSDLSVYYFAADRPRQGMEAFKRSFAEKDRTLLRKRLHIHKGPPPFRLSSPRGQQWLLREVEETGAGLVILDSRKDFGSTTNADEVAGVVTAVQLLVASDIEVLLLHHPNEASLRRKGPPELADISGHGAVYSGMGSVLFLKGRAGSTLIDVHHLKPIREVVPPFKIQHDHALGISERLAEGIVVGEEKGELTEGRMPSDKWEVRVLALIDAQPGEWCESALLKEFLGSENLSRDLRDLARRKVVEHNGKRGGQSAWRRGPDAPPRK